MKSIEEICCEFYKSEEDIERDFILLLRSKESGMPPPVYMKGEYLQILLEILTKMGHLEDKVWYSEITWMGKDAIRRGWVLRDYASNKRKESWKEYREWLALLVAIILGILGLFFPR